MTKTHLERLSAIETKVAHIEKAVDKTNENVDRLMQDMTARSVQREKAKLEHQEEREDQTLSRNLRQAWFRLAVQLLPASLMIAVMVTAVDEILRMLGWR